MDDLTYSHDDVWLLLHCLPTMRYAKEGDTENWRKFQELVSDETANGYSPHWNVEFTLSKMANDIGSYKLLLNIWLQVDEVMSDLLNPIHK